MKPSRSSRRTRSLGVLAGLVVVPSIVLVASVAFAENVVAVTSDGRVITFDSATPGTLTSSQVLTGIDGTVVAIDLRPSDRVLHAVTSGARLYRIDVATGAATAVGSRSFAAATGLLTGIDFNAGDGLLHIVNDANRSLRVDSRDASLADGNPVLAGTQEDAQLVYAPADANFATDPTIVGLASDATSARFGIDTGLNVLVTLAPAPQGMLQTVGALGVVVAQSGGFDVSPTTTSAYAVFRVQGGTSSGLYNVNPQTGGVTLAGFVGYPSPVVAMAVGTPAPIEIAPGRSLVGLSSAGELIRFRSDAPDTITSRVAVTGLVAGDTLLALDTRSTNGRLYGLGSGGRIYVIHAATGVASVIRTAPFEVPLSGTSFDIDFDPAGGRIRIVSDSGQNLRVDADTGAVLDGDAATAGVQGDTSLSYAAGDVNQGMTPRVVAVAYDRTESSSGLASLFVIDANLGVLARLGSSGGSPESPNSGVLRTIGSLGADTTLVMGFEILGNSTGVAALGTPGGAARLYSIDLATGAATLIGDVGSGENLRDLSAPPTSNPPVLGTDLSVRKLTIRLEHRRDDRDSVTIDAVVPFPSGALPGQTVVLDVGGFTTSFTLGRRGTARNDEETRSRRDDDTFAFAARPRDGHLRFRATVRRADLSDELADEGMGSTETARNEPRTVQVTVTVGDEAYSIPVPLRFTARAGKSGLAHLSRN